MWCKSLLEPALIGNGRLHTQDEAKPEFNDPNSSEISQRQIKLKVHQLSSTEGYVATCSDSSVLVYSTAKPGSPHMRLNFDSRVDCINWTDRSGNFLLAADQSGKLHTIHMKSQRIISSEKLCDADKENEHTPAFLQLQILPDKGVMTVLTSDSQLHVYTRIKYTQLDEALCRGDAKEALSLKQKIVHRLTSVPIGTTNVVSLATPGLISLICIGGASRSISIIDYSNDSFLSSTCCGMSRYGRLVSGTLLTPMHLLTLTDQGCLILWNLVSVTAVKVWKEHRVVDVARLTPVQEVLSEVQLVLLIRCKDKPSQSLQVVRLPNLDCIYSQSVSQASIASDYTNQLEVHYLDTDARGVQLHSISQASKEARLSQLVSLHLFDEATEFCKSQSLDMQTVYRSLAAWCSSKLPDEPRVFPRLREALDSLTDHGLAVEISLRSRPLEFQQLDQLMKFVEMKVRLHGAELSECLKPALRILSRFRSFPQASPTSEYTPGKWSEFLHVDMAAVILRLAQCDKTREALTLWTLNKTALLPTMTSDWLNVFLSLYPSHIHPTELSDWLLNHLIRPLDSAYKNEHMIVMVQNIDRIAADMEQLHLASWIADSIRLCKLVEEIHRCVIPLDIRVNLTSRLSNLVKMAHLREKYNLVLTYGQYVKETPDSLVFRLLDLVVVPATFSDFLNRMVVPYMKEHAIDGDTALIDYVQDLWGRHKHVRSYDREGLLWERKAVAALRCVAARDRSLVALLTLVDFAARPWSHVVAQLVDEAIEWGVPRVSELRSKKERVNLLSILELYTIPREVTPSRTNCVQIIRCILKRGGTSLEGLRHALQVGKVYGVAEREICYLAANNRLNQNDDVTDVLNLLPPSKRTALIGRLINKCLMVLEDSTSPGMRAHWAQAIRYMISCNQAELQALDEDCMAVSKQIGDIITLQQQFDLIITPAQLSDRSTHQIFNHFLCEHSTDIVNLKWNHSEDYLAELLRIPPLKVLQSVYHSCKLSLDQLVVYLCGCLQRLPSASLADASLTLLSSVLTAEALHSLLLTRYHSLYALLGACFSLASNDQLPLRAGLLTRLRIYEDVMSHCLLSRQLDRSERRLHNKGMVELFTRKFYTEKDMLANWSPLTRALSKLYEAASCKDRQRLHDAYTELADLLTEQSLCTLGIQVTLFVSRFPVASSDSSTLTNRLNSDMKALLLSLCNKLLAQRNLDVHLCLGLMLNLNTKTALMMSKRAVVTYRSQYLRTLALSNVCIVLCQRAELLPELTKCQTLQLDAVWGYILSKYEVDFTLCFSKPNKAELLPKLANNAPMEVFDQYARAYACSEHEMAEPLLQRLRRLCSKHESSNQVALTEVSTLISRLGSLKNEEIERLIEETQPYNYELLQLLVKHHPNSSKRQKLLDYLLVYKRVNSVGEWEMKYLQSHGTPEPSTLSQSRLPFHPLLTTSVWKIIKPELSMETVSLLTPLATLLEFSAEKLIINTVMQEVEQRFLQTPNQNEFNKSMTNQSSGQLWTSLQSDEKFFTKLVELMAKIPTLSNAVMCCHAILDKLPPGSEKVTLTKIALDLSKTWRNQLDQDSSEYTTASRTFSHLKCDYVKLAVEQRLRRSQLYNESRMGMFDQPSHLIQDILEECHNDTLELIERRYAVCCEVARLNEKDLNLIVKSVMDGWIGDGDQGAQANLDMDMTVTVDFGGLLSAESTPSSQLSDLSTKEKLFTTLACSPLRGQVVNLLNAKLMHSSSPECRWLAARCLHAIGSARAPPSCAVTSSSRDALISRSAGSITETPGVTLCHHLHIITQLRQININMIESELEGCDKVALINNILRNYSNNSTAVSVLCDLSLSGDVEDLNIWSEILDQLVSLSMTDKLVEVLPHLSNNDAIWSRASFVQAWRYVRGKSGGNSSAKSLLDSCPILPLLG